MTESGEVPDQEPMDTVMLAPDGRCTNYVG